MVFGGAIVVARGTKVASFSAPARRHSKVREEGKGGEDDKFYYNWCSHTLKMFSLFSLFSLTPDRFLMGVAATAGTIRWV